jgi:hypothetical protein
MKFLHRFFIFFLISAIFMFLAKMKLMKLTQGIIIKHIMDIITPLSSVLILSIFFITDLNLNIHESDVYDPDIL